MLGNVRARSYTNTKAYLMRSLNLIVPPSALFIVLHSAAYHAKQDSKCVSNRDLIAFNGGGAADTTRTMYFLALDAARMVVGGVSGTAGRVCATDSQAAAPFFSGGRGGGGGMVLHRPA